MLTLEKVAQIRRLLDEDKLSQRAIARETGVSRGTVQAIANGNRGLHGRESTPLDDGAPALVPTRCCGCGAMVFAPCVLCRARDYRRRNWRRGESGLPPDPNRPPRQVA